MGSGREVHEPALLFAGVTGVGGVVVADDSKGPIGEDVVDDCTDEYAESAGIWRVRVVGKAISLSPLSDTVEVDSLELELRTSISLAIPPLSYI